MIVMMEEEEQSQIRAEEKNSLRLNGQWSPAIQPPKLVDLGWYGAGSGLPQ